MKKTISFTLALLLLMTLLTGCFGKKSDGINRVTVFIPTLSEAEEVTEIIAAMSVNSYLQARMYLDEFLQYDIFAGTSEEYRELLAKTISAFEAADALSEELAKSVDVWNTVDDKNAGKASYKAARADAPSVGFTVNAAEDSPAVKWAKDITEAFDKAPAGKGIRTLASQLGTDAKHAYAQLKQAQDILEGADYEDIADAANTAYQTATVLKAAGTAAAFVVSIPAAPAATTLGTVIATGGCVCSGVNALLEIGSAGSVIYTNGEGNWVTAACDKTEGQFAPIGQIFGIAGVCTNIAGLKGTYNDVVKNGKEFFTPREADDVLNNTFGIISYGAGTLTDYIGDGKILSGTFTKTKDGIEFTLADTLLGKEPGENGSAQKLIDETADKNPAIKKALNEESAPVKTEASDPIPSELAEKIINSCSDTNSQSDISQLRDAIGAAVSKAADSPVEEITGPEDGGEEPEKEPEPEYLPLSEILGDYEGEKELMSLTLTDEAYQMYVSELEEDEEMMTKAECDAALQQLVDEGGLGMTGVITIAEADGKVTVTANVINDDGDVTPVTADVEYKNGKLVGPGTVDVEKKDGQILITTDGLDFSVTGEEYEGKVMFYAKIRFEAAK